MFAASRRARAFLDIFMNRHPRFAPSQEQEAKQTLLDQLRALAAEDPDFFTDPSKELEKVLAQDGKPTK
ncbi:MAG TPA: hypothetical protein VGP28_09290 [Methylocella sp.]|nr:hypothetical protein [Methylocella sp.]